MKNVCKVFSAIVFAALIGFSFAACSDGSSSGGGGAPPLSGTITISPNGTVTPSTGLTAIYNGSENVSYQWKKSSANVGTNSDRFTPTDEGIYTVTVSAVGYQSKTSAPVTVEREPDWEQWGDFRYYEKNGTITITYYDDRYEDSITIPAQINGKPVTSIAFGVFDNHRSLTTITVDAANSAYTAQDGVLYNKSKTVLHTYPAGKEDTAFTIPSSVTSIGDYAFIGCLNLESVTIPGGVTSIGDYAFGYCYSLESVTIPDSITSIGDRAFSYCLSLESVTIPNSVTSIGNSAFYDCTNLTAINVDYGNTNYSSDQGVLYNKNKTYLYTCPRGKTGTYTIPDSVTRIGRMAFGECRNLESVTIPSGVTSIGDGAFFECTSLTAINVDTANSAYSSQGGVLYNKSKTVLIKYPAGKTDTAFAIPNSVTNIGRVAFEDCRNLTSVTISDGITSIEENTFFNCTSLTSVIIGKGVTSIERFSFWMCDNLTSVTFQGTISSSGFGYYMYGQGDDSSLREKYLAGGPGTYILTVSGDGWEWTKQ